MKINGKIIVSFMALIVCCFISVVPAEASTIMGQSRRNTSYFNKEWEKITTYNIGSDTIGKMIWGYDTTAVNEDYAWTMGYTCKTTAGIFRDGYDSSVQWDDAAAKNAYSKNEQNHKTYYVDYYIKFGTTYAKSDITQSTATTTIK